MTDAVCALDGHAAARTHTHSSWRMFGALRIIGCADIPRRCLSAFGARARRILQDAHQPFWAQITEHGITPITTEECAASAVSADDAKQFLKLEETKEVAAVLDADESEDEDDMVDDL